MVLEQNIALPGCARRNAWDLHIGREICRNVQAGLNHEWLVTNGLGGYAAGSIVGATTRSYHGLLVASLSPPDGRTVLISKLDEEVILDNGQTYRLGVNEYQGGIIEPQGYVYLETVSLDGDIPCFVYRLSETLTLEKRIWMEYGQNTTYVQYTLRGTLDANKEGIEASGASAASVNPHLTMLISPFCLTRDYHKTTQGASTWHFLVENAGNRCRVRAYEGAPAYHLIADSGAAFEPAGLWYWRLWHRKDNERGLPDVEDVYQPGIFRLTLGPGERKTLVFTTEMETTCSWGYGGARHEEVVAHALMRHQRRVQQILAVADPATDELQVRDPVMARLVLAADQFIVDRPNYAYPLSTRQQQHLSPDRKTIIAGYPWFTDWGRDSMISLPGLLLCTGRYSEARGLLKAFTSYIHKGLIPNRFPDNDEEPVYNTVDAGLWMFRAIDHYLLKTGDWTLLRDLFPTLQDSIQWYIHGTEYGIHVDPQDGLLHAGVSGVQLTWMDAKIGDWVVTPRSGKPVEVNALWYYALSAMEDWAVHLSTDATQYGRLRGQVRQNFAARFWYEEGGYLYDVVDVEGIAGRNDASLRPNQLFAASLHHELLSELQVASVLQKVTEHLFTPAGLRSLSPTDPACRAHFTGDRQQRDSAYHQGAVWQWLIGAYVDVHLRVHNDYDALLPLLQPFIAQLWETCLGTLSEVAEPEPPFVTAGCFAQAWSIAEVLRCWQLIRSSLS
ncbi:MAG: amylo-alpha-1,6-glucosidase [Ktedonobacteraceae bacterium]